MGLFSVNHSREGTGAESFDDLIAKLSDPRPLLTALGTELSALIQDNLTPGHGRATGKMASGFDDFALYQEGDGWAIGIGDPSILGNWQANAPSGTIAAFIRWMYGENKKLADKKDKLRKARARLEEKRRARMEKIHAKWDVIYDRRVEFRKGFRAALEDLALHGEHYSDESAKYLDFSESTRNKLLFKNVAIHFGEWFYHGKGPGSKPKYSGQGSKVPESIRLNFFNTINEIFETAAERALRQRNLKIETRNKRLEEKRLKAEEYADKKSFWERQRLEHWKGVNARKAEREYQKYKRGIAKEVSKYLTTSRIAAKFGGVSKPFGSLEGLTHDTVLSLAKMLGIKNEANIKAVKAIKKTMAPKGAKTPKPTTLPKIKKTPTIEQQAKKWRQKSKRHQTK